MANYIVDYQATKDERVIYSGTLAIEADGNDDAVKAAIVTELASINKLYGGGIPDTVMINNYDPA